MKSSLSMTTIALLLGGVLQLQSLAASGVSIDTIAAELGNSRGRYAAANGAEVFTSDLEAIIAKSPDQRTLREKLTTVIAESPLSAEFFEAARKKGTTTTKGILNYFEGLRTACPIVTDSLTTVRTALSDLQKTSTQEITELQSALEELRVTHTSLQQQLKNPAIRAFWDLGPASEIRAVETLPAFLATGTYTGQLPLAEQMYLLQIRSQLASSEGLITSLNALDALLTSVRNIASNDKVDENLARASFLVDAIPHIRGVVPIIGEYLQLILGKIKTIDDAVNARSTMFWKAQPEALENLQLQELRARQNLAYAVFDAFFGTMTRPSTVAAPVAFNIDPKPANILTSVVHTMHRNLPAITPSQRVTVKNDGATAGTIATINDAAFSTVIDMTSGYMTSVRTETIAFLKKMLGAKELVRITFASAALAELSELPTVVPTQSPKVIEMDDEEEGDEPSATGGNDSSQQTLKILEDTTA